MKRVFFLITAIFFFTACSMPETKIYSLSLPAERKLANNKSDSSVNLRVSSPRYLSQQYIAYRTSPYQIDISKYSKWESSPVEMIRDAFKDSFYSRGISKDVKTSKFVPSGYYSVDIQLRRFERTGSDNDQFGEIDFEAVVSSPEGKEIYRKTVSRRIRLENKDNLNLAKSLSLALSEGVEEAITGIAAVMNNI